MHYPSLAPISKIHHQRISAQSKIFKALGHPTRLLMAEALSHGDLCVCQLQSLIESGNISTISKHLSILKDAGVVHDEKRGTNVYYHLDICCLSTFLECSLSMIKSQANQQIALLG